MRGCDPSKKKQKILDEFFVRGYIPPTHISYSKKKKAIILIQRRGFANRSQGAFFNLNQTLKKNKEKKVCTMQLRGSSTSIPLFNFYSSLLLFFQTAIDFPFIDSSMGKRRGSESECEKGNPSLLKVFFFLFLTFYCLYKSLFIIHHRNCRHNTHF